MEMDIQTAIWRGRTAQTVPINNTSAATTAIFTPDPGKRFACHYLVLQFADVGTGTIQFLSGSTPLTGLFTYDGTPSAKGETGVILCCSGMPVFIGRANGDVFNMTTVVTANNFDTDGFAVMTQLDGIL